jgi:hypothetical protein
MRVALPILSLGAVAQALHFYVDGTSPKCFYEELPKDTLVVGHYEAQEWDDRLHSWSKHDGISIYISVDVSFPSPGLGLPAKPLSLETCEQDAVPDK